MILIREMLCNDLAEVLEIETGTQSPWTFHSISTDLSMPGRRRLLVAQESHPGSIAEIVGWYSVSLVFPEAELLKIAVKIQKRRQGIGSALFGHLLASLTAENFESLFLEVRSQNQTALKLYKKNGLVEVARRRNYYTDPTDDALVLRKTLTTNYIQTDSQ